MSARWNADECWLAPPEPQDDDRLGLGIDDDDDDFADSDIDNEEAFAPTLTEDEIAELQAGWPHETDFLTDEEIAEMAADYEHRHAA